MVGIIRYMDQNDEELEQDLVQTPLSYPLIVGSFLLLFAHFPVGYLLGLCSFGVNPFTWGSAFKAFLFIGLFLIGVEGILARPISQWIYPQLKPGSCRILRIYLIALLVVPPLLSFSYFVGGIRELMDFHDIFICVVPAVFIGSILFDVYRRHWLFSAFLGTATAIPIFIINDVLSGFEVPINYFSSSGSFYLWRTALPILAVWSVVLFYRNPFKDVVTADTFRNFCFGFLGLSIYAFALRVLLPFGISISQKVPVDRYWVRDLWWILYLGAAFFFIRRTRLGYFVLALTSGMSGLVHAVRIAFFVCDPNTTFWGLSWFSNQLCALLLFAWAVVLLVRKDTRQYYGVSLT